MNLNRRLLLAVAPVLVILLAVGLYAIFLFQKLGGAIDVILRENYRSVVACQNMKEASERMDSGLLFMVNGEEARGRQMFEQYTPIFQKNLEVEAHNITLPGEGQMEASVAQLHARYMDAAARFMALPATDPKRRSLYFDELLPTFTNVKEIATHILDINQENWWKPITRRATRARMRHAI